jgi:outer membrane protein assembly factor BamA
VYRASLSYFSDRSDGNFSFHRYEIEGAQFKTNESARLTLAARGWLTGSDGAEAGAIPLYLMPSLGGNNTLRAFANFRFHDRHMLVGNVEMRLAIWDHLDAAVFVDAGNVAATLSSLDLAKRSYGAGLRMHSKKATFIRLDVAHGAEGWRLTFNTSDPLHLSRLSRRTAPVPFVP